jgi:hypothetical protein
MAIVNYSFQKNMKEQARKKKQEEKRLLKLNKKMQSKERLVSAADSVQPPDNNGPVI